MKNSSQALMWSAFQLSWPALLTQIAGAVTVVFLIDLAIDPSTDSRSIFEAADLVLLLGFVFLFVVTLHRMQNSGRTPTSLGFPYRLEFSYPVSTATLTFVPLFYFCVMTQIGVFVPGMIMNALFLDVGVSYLPISFVLFQFTVLALVLTWWTTNGLLALLGYMVAFYLYGYGYLVPDYTRIEDSWLFEVNSNSDYIVPLLWTSALLILCYFGVRQQRSGETLLNFGQKILSGGNTGTMRNLLPVPVSECPTSSPIKAEYWKERQLHGAYRASLYGLGGSATILAIFSIISIFVPGDHNIVYENVVLLIVAIYWSLCVGVTATAFGVSYKNGIAKVSVHEKTIPMSTARLTFIRFFVSLSSVFVVGAVITVVMWVLGPLMIEGFVEMRVQFLESFDFLAELSFFGAVLRIVLSVIAFLTVLSLVSIFLTWFMLYSKKMTIAVTSLAIYTLLLVYGTIFFTDDAGYNAAIDSVGRGHLWVLILLIPASAVFMLRKLLEDDVIDKTQMSWLVSIGALLLGLNLIWIFGVEHYGAMQLDIIPVTVLSYLTIQGLLPLFTAVFALWTSHKIRHG